MALPPTILRRITSRTACIWSSSARKGKRRRFPHPFSWWFPGVGADGGNAYTLNVKPTGTVEAAPRAEVNVGEVGSADSSFDVGQIHTWILRGSVPSGIRTAQKYTITGSFNEHLALNESAPTVSLLTRAGAEIGLTEGDHYTVSHNDGGGELCVSLTPAGMAYAAANQGEGACAPEIRVRVRAAITENAGLGTSIPCVASIGYLNAAGIFYEAQSEAGEVHTGGIHLFVSDEAGQPLSGGTFRLARAGGSSDDESAVLKVNGAEINVTFVNFLTESSEKPVSEVTTRGGWYGAPAGGGIRALLSGADESTGGKGQAQSARSQSPSAHPAI